MHAALLLAILATAPDEYGPLILSADAEYLAHRLIKVENNAAAESFSWRAPAEADLRVCSMLFDDCREAVDEFQRKAALERHQKHLVELRAQISSIKTAVLGGVACFGEYDFKKGAFPLRELTLSTPGLTAPEPEASPALYPAIFKVVAKSTKPIDSLKVPEARAAELRQISPTGCFQVRAEVLLPAKPIRWVSNVMAKRDAPGTWSSTEPPVLTLDLKRVRLIAYSPQGETLATF